MTQDIATVAELRRALRDPSICYVFVRVQLSDDLGIYVQTSKTQMSRAVSHLVGADLARGSIRADEPDAIYID